MLDTILKQFTAKKKEMEKYRLSVNLPAIDAQISRLKQKEFETPIEKVKSNKLLYIYTKKKKLK